MSLQSLSVLALGLSALILLGLFLVVLRHTRSSRSAQALDAGDLHGAVAGGEAPGADLGDLLAAATAARQLGQLERSAALAHKAVRDDPDNGEAWVEHGLTGAHLGEITSARAAFARAMALRADLAESITLHRAWLELRAREPQRAKRMFDEIDVALETKLRLDLGSGDSSFAEWFFQAAELWAAFGAADLADWARREGERSPSGRHLLALYPAPGDVNVSTAPGPGSA